MDVPTLNRPDQIDILLGAEYYHQLLSIGQIKFADNLQGLQNTTLGWIVSGKVFGQQLSVATCWVLTEDDKIDVAIVQFWKLEELENNNCHLMMHNAKLASIKITHVKKTQDSANEFHFAPKHLH